MVTLDADWKPGGEMHHPGRWETHKRYPYLLAKYGGFAVLASIAFALLYRLRVVVIPIIFAALLAYLLAPLTDFLERRKIPRVLGAAFSVAFGLTMLALIGAVALPHLFSQLQELAERLPMMIDVLDQNLSPFLQEHFGLTLHFDRASFAQSVRENLESLAVPTGWLLSRAFKSIVTLGLAVFYLVVVVVFTFYLLRSYWTILRGGLALIPRRYHEKVIVAARAVDEALSGFVRGQIIVCVIMASIYAVALNIVGVQGGTVIGILAGLLNFVPYFGILTGLLLSLMSVVLDYEGLWQVVAVLAVFAGGPLLDATLITPNIVGQRVGLNPFLVIVVLLVGADLMGFLGLLLAIPAAAVMRALVRLWVAAYKESRFYKGDFEDAEGGDGDRD